MEEEKQEIEVLEESAQELLEELLPEGAIMDSDGNIITNPTLKQETIARIAYEFSNDDEMEDRAIQSCIKSGRYTVTLEQFIEERFYNLLDRYPHIKKDYENELLQDREKNKKVQTEKRRKFKKARRKLKRKNNG